VAKCAVCGTQHATCGPRTTVVPIDSAVAERKEGAMSDLKRYAVEIPGRGGPKRTSMLLSDEDAKRQGLLGNKVTAAGKTQPSNKAAKAGNTK